MQDCLIYIESDGDVNGTTRQGVIVAESYDKNDKRLFVVDVITAANGELYNVPERWNAEEEDIVSLRPFDENVGGKIIYHFSVDNNVVATNFLKKSDSVSSVSMRPLGSGILGTWFKDDNLPAIDNVTIYKIEMKNPYPVQDTEHYNSLLNASLNINLMIESLRREVTTVNPELRSSYVASLLTSELSNQFKANYRLWWIVLWRTEDELSEAELMSIIDQYISDLLMRDQMLIDSVTGSELIELPVNYILKSLGYTGVVSRVGNSVNYDIEAADDVRASRALYTNATVDI